MQIEIHHIRRGSSSYPAASHHEGVLFHVLIRQQTQLNKTTKFWVIPCNYVRWKFTGVPLNMCIQTYPIPEGPWCGSSITGLFDTVKYFTTSWLQEPQFNGSNMSRWDSVIRWHQPCWKPKNLCDKHQSFSYHAIEAKQSSERELAYKHWPIMAHLSFYIGHCEVSCSIIWIIYEHPGN